MTEPHFSVGAKNQSASSHRDWSSTDGPAYTMKAASLLWSRWIGTSQTAKAKLFDTLHAGSGALVVASVFDAGSARIVAGLEFETVATSSGGFAATLGRKYGRITREEAPSHGHAVFEATYPPSSAGLEHGFNDAPEAVAKTVLGTAR